MLKKNFKLFINFDFVSNIQYLFQHQLNKQLFLLLSLCIPDTWNSYTTLREYTKSTPHVHYNIMCNSQMSESHAVDMVASRHALQLMHCSMSTSLFSQPYCAQCNGDNARGFANHVNGWKKLRKKPQFSLKSINFTV